MNYYELAFIGFDGDCYNVETSWLINTDKDFNEMQGYVININKDFQAKYPETKSYFVLSEEHVLNKPPTLDLLIEDLKEL